MLRELQKRIKEFHMIEAGDCVLVGVSGGADSVCLLLVLHALQKELDFTLEAVHVEHGIRGAESLEDAAFVEELCRRMQVPCYKESVDVPAFCKQTGLGTEEAARILRYQVFSKLALEKRAKIALAHHQEDNAETILFQMARGSALAGLCGIRPIRVDENGVCYIRPLLFFHRAEIEDFLKSHGEAWCIDSTNTELEYSRNFLRAKVIPDLMQVNTQAVSHINQTAQYLSEIKDYLDWETERLWSKLAKVDQKITLDRTALLELHPVMQKQIVYKAIVCMAKQKKDITSAHVEEVLTFSECQSGKKLSLPYGISVWRDFDMLCLAVGEAEQLVEEREYVVTAAELEACQREKSTISLAIGDNGEQITCRIVENSSKNLEIPRKTYTKWFDYDKIKDGFCIRTRRSGDYFISDALGHRKKLKTYFTDEKISVEERNKRWLLAKDHEVLWLIGGRISEHIKVTQKTRYILEITYDGGKKHE